MIIHPTRKGLERLLAIHENMQSHPIEVRDGRILVDNAQAELYNEVYCVGRKHDGDAIIVAYAYKDNCLGENRYSLSVYHDYKVANRVLLAVVKRNDDVIIDPEGWHHVKTGTKWMPKLPWCSKELRIALSTLIEERRKLVPMVLVDGKLMANGHPAKIGHKQDFDGHQYVMTAYGETNFGIDPSPSPIGYDGKIHDMVIYEPIEDVR